MKYMGTFLFLLFVALGMLLLYLSWNPMRLLLVGERVIGIVEEHVTSESGLKSLKVSFYNHTGKQMSIISRTSVQTPSRAIGESVSVYIDSSGKLEPFILAPSEFYPHLFLFGFISFLFLLNLMLVTIGNHPEFGDPFGILLYIVSSLKLHPVLFPVKVLLTLVILTLTPFTFSMIKKTLDLRLNGVIVQGEVIRIESVKSKKRNFKSSSYALVSFSDRASNEVKVRLSVNNEIAKYKPGDSVEMIYSPSIPSKAVMNTVLDIYFPVLLLIFIELICSVGVYFAFFRPTIFI